MIDSDATKLLNFPGSFKRQSWRSLVILGVAVFVNQALQVGRAFGVESGSEQRSLLPNGGQVLEDNHAAEVPGTHGQFMVGDALADQGGEFPGFGETAGLGRVGAVLPAPAALSEEGDKAGDRAGDNPGDDTGQDVVPVHFHGSPKQTALYVIGLAIGFPIGNVIAWFAANGIINLLDWMKKSKEQKAGM